MVEWYEIESTSFSKQLRISALFVTRGYQKSSGELLC